MKTSIEWLSQFLPGPALDPQAVGEALTHAGLPVETFLDFDGDPVLDVEVTSNRGDCLSHLGVARELSALWSRPLRPPTIAAPESAAPVSSVTSVTIDAPALCPHYTARIIRGVKIGPSPDWLVRRLQAVITYKDGSRYKPINNVVDITNYVMFELGQPLHAFDLDKLAGRRIVVREALGGETMVAINGDELKLAPPMLVIADAEKPVALAGVMGGLHSEVGPDTVNILLESARFDPLSVRRTSRALKLASDSSYRFERQIDPLLPERASLRAAQLILELAGGELLAGVAQAGSTGWTGKALTLRLGKLRSVLGVELPVAEVIGALDRLGLSPKLSDDGAAIAVSVPSHRLDLNIEVDLVEEVARVVGYGRIPTRDTISIRAAGLDPEAKALDTIRDALVGAGYCESVTFGFVSDALAGDFRPPEAAALLRADASVRKDNARLRPSILPGLLESVRHNEANGTLGAKLFETGSTYWLGADGKVDERRRLALVGTADWREVRGAVEEVLARLDADKPVAFSPQDRPGFAAGACAVVTWGDKPIGHVGRVARAVAEKLSLRELPCAAELELADLLAGAQHVPQLRPLPEFPAARRDLSVVLPEATPYVQLESLLKSLDLPHLESLEYVTTYRGKPLEKGTKSVTVTLVFRSRTGTLTGDEVEAAVARAVAALHDRLGAQLRT